ncbi:MogA/MoaB family molybdenum cofactor biosynthesis protein [Limnochorda pilosa]|uniref:Molybdenum cofactor synthesis protein n=1 Tax=Limnochorda pilosa TaxID=1555112 RepID=A0A0K2SPG1_LIMPI|nr:MogA/MoaB family molybdenum cofactor biosynthesis protein [Limnochorda pilosa]BAS28991.1 molybdenum cofactor synthesis protein [Limnochorda pilosa]
MQVAVLTVSDSKARAGGTGDTSGEALQQFVEARGGTVVWRGVVPDEPSEVSERLRWLADVAGVPLILTTGGTGLTPRDRTPEATRAVLDREAPGLSEAMRVRNLERSPASMLSRGVCGVRGRSLILNLPGSPRGAVESLDVVWPQLGHAVGLVRETREGLHGDAGSEVRGGAKA